MSGYSLGTTLGSCLSSLECGHHINVPRASAIHQSCPKASLSSGAIWQQWLQDPTCSPFLPGSRQSELSWQVLPTWWKQGQMTYIILCSITYHCHATTSSCWCYANVHCHHSTLLGESYLVTSWDYLQAGPELPCHTFEEFGLSTKNPYAQWTHKEMNCLPLAIVGVQEYIFSENIGILGDLAARKEQTFGTLTAHHLAWIGGKLHYGHLDFLNATFMSMHGGVSKV